MRIAKSLRAAGVVWAAALATTLSLGTPAASAAPDYKMPFRCGFTATAATFAGHSPANSVDFQKSGITGTPVLASAGGTVSVVADEGSTSYGKWIEIDHGGGFTTRYAHLSAQGVSEGDKVSTGTQIGKAGATGGVTGPHLHYEQRSGGVAQKVTLSGRAVPYYGHTSFTSKNCGGGGGNPYTAKEVCGSGFSTIDRHALGKAGTVYLMYNASSGKNCVTTLKASSLGKKTAASAFLEVKGGQRATDSGQFSYYAGPVSAAAANKCVQWGGSVGSEKYSSQFEHCG
jgi:hypothetical protein